jgi:TfoX/Sxy family transcriptional regulator of competence genes
MASDASFVEYVCDQAGLGARVTTKRMFGEYALYVDGKVTAFICDNQVFLKPTAEGRAAAPGLPEGPPYPQAKDYLKADVLLDDPPLWKRALLVTADALPLPKPKPAKKAARPKR